VEGPASPRSNPRRIGGGELSAEVRELVAPRGPLGVAVPAYDGRSLPNVATSLVRALGGEPAAPALPPLARALDPFADGRAAGPVLLFVVDGLGYQRLRERGRRPGGRAARAWLAHTAPITSVFPSTTTVALVSLATGAPPSRHGVVGYRQFLPRIGSVVDILRMSPLGVVHDDALVGPAWSPSTVVGAPTIYRQGISGAVAVSRDRFEARGFTRMVYDGAEYEPYSAWADLAAALVHLLGRAAPPPLVLAYWDELDTVQHLRGPAAPSVDLEIDRLTELLAFVARGVGPKAARTTTVLVTADHGLVPVDPAAQTAVDAQPSIADHLGRPPTGDRRAGLFKARAGEVGALEQALREGFPPGTTVLPSDAAVRHGLFGPPPYHPELLERIGDLVVLVPSPGGITYALAGRGLSRRVLFGAHGGLEADELIVPLVAGRLDEFSLDGAAD